MSIKALAALVFLLVLGIFASTRCYLAADQRYPTRVPLALDPSCDETADGVSTSLDCAEVAPDGYRSSLRSTHLSFRSAVEFQRREAAAQTSGDS
ncbi:MAG TPA: hypothetical protein VK843_21330 [Planctomycetota bacterium]|nr:hypothetical protein [Planctomycetota bacterium]